MDIRARTNVTPLFRSTPAARRNAAAGLLGAVTAIGTIVLITLAALAAALLITRARGAHLEDLAAAVLSRGIAVEVLLAALLSGTVLGAFSCGGYVAVRLTGAAGRRQALSVWLWTASVPVGLNLAALAAAGSAYRVLAAVETDKPVIALVLSSTGLALLGALLGADTAARGRGAAPLEPARPEVVPVPAGAQAAG